MRDRKQDSRRLCRRESVALQRAFEYPDLLAHLTSKRVDYVADALTILRAHLLAGRPTPVKRPRLGTFESWDRVVRDAVTWAFDGADPAATQKRLDASGDDDREQLAALLAAWKERLGEDAPYTLAAAIKCAAKGGTLYDALSAFDPKHAPGRDLSGTGIARQLKEVLGRNVGGLCLESTGIGGGGVAAYRVTSVRRS